MFKLEWEWSDYVCEYPLEWKHTFADLQIIYGDRVLTKNFATSLNSVRHATYVPLYEVAEWLCRNWFFLKYEVNEANVDYHLRHNLRTSASGFSMPDILIYRHDNMVCLQAVSEYKPIHTTIEFLTGGRYWFNWQEFEDEVIKLIYAVIGRLEQTGIAISWLHENWKWLENLQEEEAEFYAAAAALGLEGVEVDDELFERLAQLKNRLGFHNLLEILAVANPREINALTEIVDSFSGGGKTIQPVSFLSDELKCKLRGIFEEEKIPFKRGYAAAQLVRQALALNKSEDVHRLLESQLQMEVLDYEKLPRGLEALLGYGSYDKLRIGLAKKGHASRLFLQTRLLAELVLNGTEKYHVLTTSRMPSQQFNRAFAAELLLPDEVFVQYADSEGLILREDVDIISRELGVSSWLVARHAYNKGFMRELPELESI